MVSLPWNLLNAEILTEDDILLENITQEHDCNDLDRHISNKITARIKSMHANRSKGPDGIGMEALKSLDWNIANFQCVIQGDIIKAKYP